MRLGLREGMEEQRRSKNETSCAPFTLLEGDSGGRGGAILTSLLRSVRPVEHFEPTAITRHADQAFPSQGRQSLL